jgi:hypothetical protein
MLPVIPGRGEAVSPESRTGDRNQRGATMPAHRLEDAAVLDSGLFAARSPGKTAEILRKPAAPIGNSTYSAAA